MAEFEITCIIKPDRQSPHEHITHVGNSVSGWMLTRESVIKRIESGKESFYVVDPKSKKKAYVGVVSPKNGRHKFIQTYSDGEWDNNLLSLNGCSLGLKLIN